MQCVSGRLFPIGKLQELLHSPIRQGPSLIRPENGAPCSAKRANNITITTGTGTGKYKCPGMYYNVAIRHACVPFFSRITLLALLCLGRIK